MYVPITYVQLEKAWLKTRVYVPSPKQTLKSTKIWQLNLLGGRGWRAYQYIIIQQKRIFS